MDHGDERSKLKIIELKNANKKNKLARRYKERIVVRIMGSDLIDE